MKSKKHIICIAAGIVLIVGAFFIGQYSHKFGVKKTSKPQKHPLIDMPVSKTLLPTLASFSADSTYAVCIFSYTCGSCLNYMENLKHYEGSPNIDKVMAFAAGTDTNNEFTNFFNPNFEIKDVSYDTLIKLIDVVPSILYIKNDTIKYVIRGTIPSIYNLNKFYFTNN
ncbi:MAG: hypothetical protein LBR17_03465 [Bacteroidales bacterium]|jgi:hypothetical protein|nr:hypothetical protein [Bacteroidales bacterium]